MRKKLVSYVSTLFARAPKSAQAREIQDEILLNTLDRYDEEIASGQSEQAAYDAAVQSIGDIDEVLEPLYPEKVGMTLQRTAAIALYICCVIPVILGGLWGELASVIGVCLMFFLIAFATYLILTANVTPKTRRPKQLRALGIALYIVCVTPTIFFSAILDNDLGGAIGVCLMFLIAAAATALVLYPSGKVKTVSAAPEAEPSSAPAQQEVAPDSTAWKIFIPVYWILVTALFFLLGGALLPWYYAWLIFPVAGALFGVISSVVSICHGQPAAKKIASSLLWLLVTLAYLLITIKTEAFYITWLCFPIGSALSGVLSGIFEQTQKGETK